MQLSVISDHVWVPTELPKNKGKFIKCIFGMFALIAQHSQYDNLVIKNIDETNNLVENVYRGNVYFLGMFWISLLYLTI